ncbi:MAG: long-chain fatty acid--CoA ligase, partial [Acetobacteraceae bacterium]|nr:long-chain fatty acid--CoA ligase [Acetobacteraceae bacterium]
MFACARNWGERTMLRYHQDGAWHPVTWREFARRAAAVARGLRAAGVSAGDRVLMVSESRPEVPIAETALMAIRAVPVPAYPTNTPEDHAHLLLDSGARVAIASTRALAERVQAGAKLTGGLDALFCMQPSQFRPFAELEADPAPPDDIAAEAELIPPGALACLMYTSGTSGLPRGVMLPHKAILANCRGAFELVRPLRLRDEVYLSFLPLSHSYEHTVGQFFLMSLGTEIVYSRGVEHLAADLEAIRPTILTLVPRILEVIRARILSGARRETPFRQRLFQHALEAGLRRLDGRATVVDRLMDPVLDRLVRRKVRDRFGGRFRAAMSGGARLDPEVGRFFLAMGVTLMQGYGQTEAGPVIAANPPEAPKIATVGVPLQGVELRIADDGEILVRGELVMDGYWGQPEVTAAAIVDGWLHTGDIGTLDPDGYLTITDRKKDIIVLSGGENVSPARVEGALMGEPEILQAVVYGDGQAGLSGLIVPAQGQDARTVADAVARVNRRLSVTERVRHHRLVPPFTVENGLLTPSQKIRRAHILR